MPLPKRPKSLDGFTNLKTHTRTVTVMEPVYSKVETKTVDVDGHPEVETKTVTVTASPYVSLSNPVPQTVSVTETGTVSTVQVLNPSSARDAPLPPRPASL